MSYLPSSSSILDLVAPQALPNRLHPPLTLLHNMALGHPLTSSISSQGSQTLSSDHLARLFRPMKGVLSIMSSTYHVLFPTILPEFRS